MMPDNEHGLHRKIIEAGIPDELLDDPEYGSLVTVQDRNRFWNRHRDWLKHKGPTHAAEMTFERADVEHMIVRAITKLDIDRDDIPEAAFGPLAWFYQTYFRQTEEEMASEFEAMLKDNGN
jgi:hypothetical protein